MHWRNSDFQKLYFIVGKCHTADEAYRQLMQLKEDREVPIAQYTAQQLRNKAKLLRTCDNEYDRIMLEADRIEIESTAKQEKACYDEALRELDVINKMIKDIQPHRKYSHLPDVEAYQACQSEEWALELIHRAENSLVTTGSMSPELLATIRLHPDASNLLKTLNIALAPKQMLLGE
jgi:hypothetical protein